MKKVRQLVLAVWLSIFLWTNIPAITQAAGDFSTTLVTTYDVTGTKPRVTQHFTFLNNQPTSYISQYGLKVSSANITNVRVSSNGQDLTPELVHTPTSTSIGITFPDQVVGEGKTRDLSISYTHPDAAVISGQVLEVSVPKLSSADVYDRYTVVLRTPTQYGQPTRMTPTNGVSEQNGNVITTTIPITDGSGVSALFGTKQWFQLQLEYDLHNPSQNVGLTQIALPPDMARQTMYYQSLQPAPLRIESDQDGNWIATYELPAQTHTTVTAQAVAAVHLEPTSELLSAQPTSALLQTQPFWDISDAQIQTHAQELSSIKAIYDFVVTTLTYDYDNLTEERPRLGAVGVLAQPTAAACQEFTDLFVTLARAKSIPARRIMGYAYTQNTTLRPLQSGGDVLHAWPEYYDQAEQQWQPVDPTWENTTGGVNYFDQFDLNHIAFTIQGNSSEYPYPAGSFSSDGPRRKLVTVEFANQLPVIEPQWNMKIRPQLFAGLPIPGRYIISAENQSGRAWYTVHITPESTHSINASTTEYQQVLPFQTIETPVTVTHAGWWLQTDTITLKLNHAELTQPVEVSADVLSLPPAPVVIGASTAVGGSLILLTLGAGRLLVRRRRR